jgi:prepilin-type N-terminal cleavage/methylation domain-containing protein
MKEIYKQGFTLVELIVVIAIIAVLSAVSIIGFSGFIDQARFSNDTQDAANMNNQLRLALVNNPDLDPLTLDAHDVRTLLNELTDTPYDFVPRSANAGFFYLNTEGRIVAVKFDEIGDYDVQLNHFEVTVTLAGDTLPVDIEAPEALFGNDRLLISTGGSVVANVVYGLRSGYSHILLENYNNPGFLEGLLRDSSHQNLLNQLLLAFNPEHTLYVNNVGWKTEADISDPSHEIQRIVFSAGIRNIPTFDDYLSGTVNYDGDIVIPRTVRSVEKYAFIQFESNVIISVNGSGSTSLVIHNQALRAGVSITGAVVTVLNQTEWEARLSAFPEGAITVVKNGSQITYSFENLPNRDSVVGYSVSVSGDTHTIRIYSEEGLVGIVEVDVTTIA